MAAEYDDDLWEVPEVESCEEYAQAGDGVGEQEADAARECGTDGFDDGQPVGYEADELDCKLLEHFGGKIVRKDLTSLMKRGANVPTFVLEYLLGMYCSTDDDDAIREGLDRIRRILSENYVRPDESERIKSKIRESGQFTIIDKVSARLDEYSDFRE